MSRLCPKECPASSVTWEIPAGVLNALFSEILPRLTGLAWCLGVDLGVIDGPRLKYLSRILPLLDPLNIFFKERFTIVDNYLDNKDPGGTLLPYPQIPIRIVGQGGYDYLLSDWGLDVVVPEPPTSASELLRYYTFRRTGRRAIGTPFYLDGANTAMSTDSPTGPGQVIIDGTVLAALIQTGPASQECKEGVIHGFNNLKDFGIIEVSQPPTLVPWIERQLRAASPPGDFQFGPNPTLFEVMEACGGADSLRDLLALAVPANWERKAEPRSKEGFILSLETYRCIMAPLRCWQVEGSVFRGMMTELPRIVATVWMEQLNSCPSASTGALPQPPEHSYADRYAKARNAGVNVLDPGYKELRKIFQERIETQLHDHNSMRFEVLTGIDDVKIRNQGIFIPEFDETRPGNADVTIESMFFQIAKGRAGNPVFTDSARTGRTRG